MGVKAHTSPLNLIIDPSENFSSDTRKHSIRAA